MGSFLNEHTGDNNKKALTSARDNGNGNPITDVNISSSSVKPLRETKNIIAISNQEVDGIIDSDWIYVGGYYDITTLIQGEFSSVELAWSSDGVMVDAREEMVTFAPLTVNVASDYVQIRGVTDSPQVVTVKLYLKT